MKSLIVAILLVPVLAFAGPKSLGGENPTYTVEDLNYFTKLVFVDGFYAGIMCALDETKRQFVNTPPLESELTDRLNECLNRQAKKNGYDFK